MNDIAIMERLVSIVGALLMLWVFACEEEKYYEESTVTLAGTAWSLVSITKPAPGGKYMPSPNPYRLRFINDSVYTLALDFNHCRGDWQRIANNRINIERAACTMVCCDSEFANFWACSLLKMTKFSVVDNVLLLRGVNGLHIKMRQVPE